MGSGRYLEDPLTFTRNPPYSSSPITESSFLEESISRSGSYESESLRGGDAESISDADFGLERLSGTVQFYERHVFLCYKKPSVWPVRIEASEFDRLPRLLSSAVSARKSSMTKETLLTICEGHDGTETSNEDVLIFPDMIRYRRLTHFDVDTFVEEVLVKGVESLPGNPESLSGSYVFICCHGSRDRRCGVCGPSLVSRFREEIELCGLGDEVSISPCSHIGGHRYTGDVIIYGLNINQNVTGHWYGCVILEDVPLLLEQHINNGVIVDRLWRGEMGLLEEDQKKTQEQRLQLNSVEISNREVTQESDNDCICFQQNGNSNCLGENHTEKNTSERVTSVKNASFRISSSENVSSCGFKVCAAMSMWLENWEKEDTYAALAVACAAASVAIAYNCYKQLK
ncbi:PREDICTED: LOW QUALITY PROTEIN: altered inheritance of mitochondria protein 32-like [Camelina sativa]|uniref:LOW QUALITY PROTEIN: altered inheritance of mitochondria protein 32-like n=1 Tax=Camelina sativa TaxID=90675 RepID=A0ABM0V3J6_CAMSA|nr:PREDICTED: LOW QUALITY PROTEIN: altered inheritance of mitochondria protein 32-like [Camelina sativa]